MKRLCFVVATDATVKTSLLHQLRALSARYRISVVANTSDLGFLAQAGIEGEVISVPIERKVALARDLRALLLLWRVFRRSEFDSVHSITPKAGLLAMLAGALAGIETRVHTFTGQVWASRTGPSRWMLKALDRLLAALATRLLADSPSQRDFLAREGVAPADKIEVLGPGSICGVDLERFRPDQAMRSLVRKELSIPDSAPLFLFVGRVNRDKGLLDLAAGFAEHADSVSGSHLVIVGPDEEGLVPELRAAAAGFEDRLRFVDLTRQPERYMAAADVLCLPSYREGFGSVIIEAAACGLPALASRIYGVVDAVVEGKTGLLHEPRDRRGIAAAMTRLAEDSGLRRELADAARARASDEFSQARLTDAVVGFYAGLVGSCHEKFTRCGPGS